MSKFNYELVSTDAGYEYIQATDETGKVFAIPADNSNSHYAEYLRYTAWVEDGQDPAVFWAQEEI